MTTSERASAIAYWDSVYAFVSPRLDQTHGLFAHGLGGLAADALEREGLQPPAMFVQQQHISRVSRLTAPLLLSRIREACSGPILVLKGPEVAERYPNQARPYGDIDILVPDAAQVQRELTAGGFVEESDPEGIWVGIHHLGRLHYPGIGLAVEIHSEPKWLDGRPPPAWEELLEASSLSVIGIDGVHAPSPAHHAVLLAVHGWEHQPLGRVRDLVDVGALRAESDIAEAARSANAWGVGRLWETTTEALDAILSGGSTWPLRLWAAHLRDVRDQTVLETHVERLLGPLWSYPPRIALHHVGVALAGEVRPAFDEGRLEKLRRSMAAMTRALSPVSAHRRKLGPSAQRGQRRNPPEDPGT